VVKGVRLMPIIVDAPYKKGSCLDRKKRNERGNTGDYEVED
jgi:hypothetical protein